MMDRAAGSAAAAEDEYRPRSSTHWAERFSTLLRNLEFLPNSPTLMNAGTELGLLSGCFVLPVEDSLRAIFTTLGQAAEIQRAGGGTGYAFSHVRPAGDRVARTGGTASGPMSFLRLYDTAAGIVSMGGRRRGACMAVLDATHPSPVAAVANIAAIGSGGRNDIEAERQAVQHIGETPTDEVPGTRLWPLLGAARGAV